MSIIVMLTNLIEMGHVSIASVCVLLLNLIRLFSRIGLRSNVSFEEALGYIAPCDIISKQLLGYLVVNLLSLLT